jgi:hypothetical protein
VLETRSHTARRFRRGEIDSPSWSLPEVIGGGLPLFRMTMSFDFTLTVEKPPGGGRTPSERVVAQPQQFPVTTSHNP